MITTKNIKQFLFLFALLLSNIGVAQTFEQYKAEYKAKFQIYKSDKQKEYDKYRQKLNTDYAAFMAKKWLEITSPTEILQKPADQDPPKPTIKEGDDSVPTHEIRYTLKITLVKYEAPQPIVPIANTPANDKETFNFQFHGTPCAVHLTDAMKYTLSDATEQAVSNMWLHLSDEIYDALISDCLKLRKDLQLGDWGYINLLQTMTQKFYGGETNEAIVMQMYILAQSGYAIRIARSDNKLVLLVPMDASLYGYSYFTRDGKHYYIIDKHNDGDRYYIFDKAFPEEKVTSLRMNLSPKFANSSAPQKTLMSRRYPSIKATITENKNLISFYNEYPLNSNWELYSAASLANETKNTLYPILKREVANKSVREAANMLINFVQTAFNYKTDGDQFGYERPLFGDETMYYPYSDCEDRSILYTILVREILGLDAVLLDYPGHLATAVNFPNNVSYGAHFTWKGKVYTICDPTYIGADIGECMPKYCDVDAKVIPIE